jgi:hypothetical protein
MNNPKLLAVLFVVYIILLPVLWIIGSPVWLLVLGGFNLGWVGERLFGPNSE